MKSPGFALVAIVTLALGIGANTAIFSVVNAVLLRPLPYKDAGRLALLPTADAQSGRAGTSYANYQVLKARSRSFESMAIYYRNSGWSRVTLTGVEDPESFQAGFVSADFFPLLGVGPALGRTFTAEEEARREPVAILSDALWKHRYSSSPDVLGRTLQLDGAIFRIIGVMPATFAMPARETQLWAPLTANRNWLDQPAWDPSHNRNFYMRWDVVARLKPGASVDAAQAEMNGIARGLEQEDPNLNAGVGIRVVPLRVELNPNLRFLLNVLLAAVGVVLLIACGNVASLLLARGRAAQRDIAIRTALGASRGRICRQLLTESVALSILGAAAGLLLAAFGTQALTRFGPPDIPRLNETSVDPPVLLFTLGVALLAAFIFGVAPAWKISQSEPNEVLKSGGHGATEAGKNRAYALLVISEFALATVLLAGAGLLIRSVIAVQAVDLGFQPESVLTMRIRLPAQASPARRATFSRDLIDNLGALPGTRAVGAITDLFESSRAPSLGLRVVEGHEPEPRTRWSALTWTSVDGDYLQAMGVRLLHGRSFSRQDGPNSALVAVIDESMARRYWPGEDAVGKRFKGQDKRGRNDDWITVIGVVHDLRRQGLENQSTPHIFQWAPQSGDETTDFVLRTAANPAQLTGAATRSVHALEPGAVISNVATMRQQLERQLAPRRFQTWLLGIFSMLALMLATTGIYAIMHYSVAQQTHEIGVRMALGARIGTELYRIMRYGLALALFGLAAGLVGAGLLTRLMSSLLYGVEATDPLTFAAVALMLLAVAALANSIPAWRASRVDPLVALRQE